MLTKWPFLFSAGGVLLSAQDEKIVCDNTLDQRLSLAFDSLLPEIRRTIFHDA
jgi:vacuolar-type H+-ATPase subunit E/Vma4